MLDSVDNAFSFVGSALLCPFVEFAILGLVIVSVLVAVVNLNKRVTMIENLSSVRDFLKTAKGVKKNAKKK